MGILKGKYSKGRTKKVSSSNRQAELLSCCWQEEPAEMTHSFDHIKLSGRGLDFTGQLPCISILIRRQLDWGSWTRECFLFLWMFTSFYLFFKKKKNWILPNRHVEKMQESRWRWKSQRDEDYVANAYCPSHTHMSKNSNSTIHHLKHRHSKRTKEDNSNLGTHIHFKLGLVINTMRQWWSPNST